MEWISVEDELPPQNWSVIVKNGKSIINHAKYYYKKWYYWSRKLHKVTHWKFSQDRRPSIPPKEMRAYLRRAEKYRHQMNKKNFITGPIRGLSSQDNLKPESAVSLIKELKDDMHEADYKIALGRHDFPTNSQSTTFP